MKYSIPYLLLLLLLAGCSARTFKTKWTTEKSPAQFKARFETTAGNFEIEATREWSPLAVDRLYQLIKHKYYTNAPIYRVVPGFVAQFGQEDTVLSQPWATVKIPDEAVIKTNTEGTVAFARLGPLTRESDIYVNTVNNHRLDTISYNGVKGFPGIAVVTSGMDVVKKFYSYDKVKLPAPDSTESMRKYRKKVTPKMDHIKKVVFVK